MCKVVGCLLLYMYVVIKSSRAVGFCMDCVLFVLVNVRNMLVQKQTIGLVCRCFDLFRNKIRDTICAFLYLTSGWGDGRGF